MWRAWGIWVLALTQEPGTPFTYEELEFSLRPPAGWVRKAPAPPAVVTFAPAEKTTAPCELEVKYLYSGNPKTCDQLLKEVKAYITTKAKGAEIKEERKLTLAERPAVRVVYQQGDKLEIKWVVLRTPVEYYFLDATMGLEDATRFRSVLEASVESFRIVRRSLTGDEIVALGRTTALLKAGKLPAGLVGESWFGIHLGKTRVGHQRIKVTESAGRYAFEIEVKSDFGEGGTDTSVVRGEFSSDGAYQKTDTERTKVKKDERWQFRASATLKDGKVTVLRDLDGTKEEKGFAVEPGTMFSDVSEFMVRAMAVSGKGTYLIRLLSPFADEAEIQKIEVNESEAVEMDGRKVDASAVFASSARRYNQTFFVGPGGALLRQGGLKSVFSIRAATKDEILKP